MAAKNKIKAAYRFWGVRYGNHEVYSPTSRKDFLVHLPGRAARQQLEQLYKNLDFLEDDRCKLNARLERMARRHPVVKTFLAIPGYGPVHSMTFYVIVDTPWRFRTVRKLWTYAGLGIQRHKSGKARPGKPHSNGPERLNWPCNVRLKNVAKCAATTVIAMKNNPFVDIYNRLVAQGISSPNAKSTVARKLLSVPWAMWKRGERYRPDLV